MTELSEDELDGLAAEMNKPAADAGMSVLVRQRTSLEMARSVIAEAAPDLVAAVDDVLSARTHNAIEATLRDVRVMTAAGLATAIAQPFGASRSGGPLLLVERETAHRLFRAAVGIDDVPDGAAQELGPLTITAIGRFLCGFVDDLAPALERVGVRCGGAAIADTAWRTLAPRVGDDAIAVAIDVTVPISASIELVIPVAACRAQDQDERGAVQAIEDHLAQTTVDVIVELGSAEVSLAELACLTPGALIPLQTTASSPLEIIIAGASRLCGRPDVAADGRLALTIVDEAEAELPAGGHGGGAA